jgi:glycine cleavage system H lipoate-binding protein
MNSAPMGAGWLFKLKLSNVEELGLLLDETAYRKLLP